MPPAPVPSTSPGRLLPETGPALMLVATDRADLRSIVDQCCLDAAGSLDVRTDVLWVEINDAPALCALLAARVDRPDQTDVRLAWARPDSTVDQLMHAALASRTLDDVARSIEHEALISDPPIYEVRYQPIIRLDDHTVIGFESLIRARQGGSLLDAEGLIGRAIDGGWLHEFDQLGRSLAIGGVGPWLGEGLLFLNLMAVDGRFDVASVASLVEEAVDAGLDPDQIVLETSERNRYHRLETAADQIAELRQLGVRVAVDDLGDGHASLAVVAAFEPDIVKLAGPIVGRLPNPTAIAIVEAVVHLAHAGGAWVVGENIEHRSQAEILRSAGVDWGQGNFLGVPEPQT